jgi:hypothetical protein
VKQYKITSEHFVLPGETGEADAHMDPADLADLKKLAGIPTVTENHQVQTDQPSMSPIGSNISITGNEKQQLEKKHGIRPGTDEWFKLWFSKPYLTGEKPIGDEPAPKVKKR